VTGFSAKRTLGDERQFREAVPLLPKAHLDRGNHIHGIVIDETTAARNIQRGAGYQGAPRAPLQLLPETHAAAAAPADTAGDCR